MKIEKILKVFLGVASIFLTFYPVHQLSTYINQFNQNYTSWWIIREIFLFWPLRSFEVITANDQFYHFWAIDYAGVVIFLLSIFTAIFIAFRMRRSMIDWGVKSILFPGSLFFLAFESDSPGKENDKNQSGVLNFFRLLYACFLPQKNTERKIFKKKLGNVVLFLIPLILVSFLLLGNNTGIFSTNVATYSSPQIIALRPIMPYCLIPIIMFLGYLLYKSVFEWY